MALIPIHLHLQLKPWCIMPPTLTLTRLHLEEPFDSSLLIFMTGRKFCLMEAPVRVSHCFPSGEQPLTMRLRIAAFEVEKHQGEE